MEKVLVNLEEGIFNLGTKPSIQEKAECSRNYTL